MATTEISPLKKANQRGPLTLLSGAICEWFLIFLLFVDATFSYFLRRFAEYCELPTPCIFCARIDTPSGKRKFDYYNALLCRSHREEISSLVSCRAHGKLTDVREMCEECAMPMHDKLNSGSYVVGKLGTDSEKHSVQRLILHKRILPTSSGPRICPCCNKTWGAKPNVQGFLQLTPVGFGASKANVKPPLPRVPGRSRFSRNSFKKLSGRLSAPVILQSEGKSPSDDLSHVGYTELKFTSDSESEMNLSDEEELFNGVRGRNDSYLEHDTHHVAGTLLELQTDDAVLDKQSNQDFADVTSLLDQHMQLETDKSLPTHGLEELNWGKPHPRTNLPISSELNLLDDVIKAPSNESAMSDDVKEVSTTAVEQPSANGSTKFEDIKSVIQESAPEQDDTQNVGESSSDFNHVQVLASLETTDSSLKLADRASIPGGSTKFEDIKSVIQESAPEQDDSHNIGESSSDFNHVQVLASLETNDSSLKLVERASIPGGSTKFEDIKSVIQQSAPEQDETQSVGESSSDFNHVQVLASLETDDSSLKLVERASIPGGSTKFEDIKSVIQQSTPEQDETQSVGESSSDFNHVQVLASLETNDSSLKFVERASIPGGSTKFEDIKSVIPQSTPGQDETQSVGESSSDFNHVQVLASLETNDSSLKFVERASIPGGSTKFEEIKSVIPQSTLEQDETHNVDHPSSDGTHVQDLPLPSLERNDSSLKFAERVSLGDVEGESSINALKSRMSDLYKELEEERNASTIAANQAMAMITRLQEEKAALHMEALQYLRMMDEQAEYDMEALQKANDELAEKEKELQDLEYELELYRNNIHGESPVPDPHKESISTLVKNTTKDSCVRPNESSMCEPSSPISTKMGIAYDLSGNAKSSIINLDEEKLYLVEYLKQLERRIHGVSCTKPCAGLNNSGHLELNLKNIDYQENAFKHDQLDSAKEADGLHMQNGFNEVDGTSSKGIPTHQLEERNARCGEANCNRCNLQDLSTSGYVPNMTTLENETENFKERLNTFEGDLEFIKHSLRALHNGNDGLEYIQQIIDQLQELRNMSLKRDVYLYLKDEYF